MIDTAGDNFIYCDTDSVYFKADPSISFEKYNNEKIEASTRNGALAVDAKGKTHYMGVAECERDDIYKFKTMGAKKYIYQRNDGVINVTTSGVGKRESAGEIFNAWWNGPDIDELLDTYSSGFIFERAGGNEIAYRDEPAGRITVHDGEQERKLYVGKCSVIKPSTYRLSLGEDYEDIIETPYFLSVANILYALEDGAPLSNDFFE